MVTALTDVDRPGLAALTTRDADDFTIALLDAWAVTADVLTFYTERLAQESYLRTATERVSLQELGRLVGYRLRPGVAAQTHLAFAIEPPPPAPPAAMKDPGSAPPVLPAVVALPVGLRVQSIPGPGEQPQTFETVEAIEARPEWNAMPASVTVAGVPVKGDTVAYLAGSGLNLKGGDAFVLAGSDIVGERWDFRFLTHVTPTPDGASTTIEWAEPLGSISPYKDPPTDPQALVLRKRLGVFGHNAPMWGAMSVDFRTNYPGGKVNGNLVADWPGFEISNVAGDTVDIEGSHPDIVVGSYLVLATPSYRELYKVAGVTELSRAEFATSGKVTRITLGGGENYSTFRSNVRGTTVYAATELLTLAEPPDASAVKGVSVRVDRNATAMVFGRTALVRGTTSAGVEHSEVVSVKEATVLTGGRSLVTFTSDLVGTYVRTTVVVHGNVALATHGETVEQLLGSGRANGAFQRFALAQAPLTHVQSTDPSGASTTLDVRVNGVRWTEVASTFTAAPGDKVVTTEPDEHGATFVQFGDGERGSRVPTGSYNLVARHRKGLGAAGNVGAGRITQALDRPLGLKGVANPASATGGVDAEAPDDARHLIPLAVRTFGRAVSLLDYEDFALGFAGVRKAQAAVLALRAGPTIVVTVSFAGDESAAASRRADLARSLWAFGDPHVELAVLAPRLDGAGATRTFRTAMRVVVDPGYDTATVLSGVNAAVGTEFGYDARSLTAPLYRSELTAVVHSVAGVVAVDIDRLYVGATVGLADRLLAERPEVGPGGTALGAGLLLAADLPFDWLEAMA